MKKMFKTLKRILNKTSKRIEINLMKMKMKLKWNQFKMKSKTIKSKTMHFLRLNKMQKKKMKKII